MKIDTNGPVYFKFDKTYTVIDMFTAKATYFCTKIKAD